MKKSTAKVFLTEAHGLQTRKTEQDQCWSLIGTEPESLSYIKDDELMAITRINNNISALNATRNLNTTSGLLSRSIERLSSGLRINRAADDAAGLSISENLRSQINGLNQAVDNANSAINLVNTAEGALNETTSRLQRIRTLAVQAANTGTNDTIALQAIQDEIQVSIDEITRIGTTTQFGSRSLLNGDNANTASLQAVGTGISLSTTPTASNLSTGTRYLTVTQTNAGSETLANGTDGVNNSGAANFTGSTFDSGTYDVVVSNVVAGSARVVSTSGSISGGTSVSFSNGVDGTNNSHISNFSASSLSTGAHSVGVSNYQAATTRVVTTSGGFTTDGSTPETNSANLLQGLYVNSHQLINTDVLSFSFTESDGSSNSMVLEVGVRSIDYLLNEINTLIGADVATFDSVTGGITLTAAAAGSNSLSISMGYYTSFPTGYNSAWSNSVTTAGSDETYDISIDGGSAVTVTEGQSGVTATSGLGGSITFDVGTGLSTGTDTLTVTGGSGAPSSSTALSGYTINDGNGGSWPVDSDDLFRFTITQTDGTVVTQNITLTSAMTAADMLTILNGAVGSDTVSYDESNGQFVITGAVPGSSSLSISFTMDNEGGGGSPELSTSSVVRAAGTDATATMTVGGGASQTVTGGGTYTFYGPDSSDPGQATPQITMTLGGTLTAGTDTLTIVAQEYQGSLEGGSTVTFQNGDERVNFLSGTAAGYRAGESLALDFDAVIDMDGGSSRTFLISAVNNSLSFQVGANQNQRVGVQFGDMRATNLGFVGETQANGNARTVAGIDVTTLTGANEALAIIDEALSQVDSQRSALGAFTNRLEATVSNLGVASENLTASESLIRDVNYAEETTTFTKFNILLQAGTSVLGQANAAPQQVLALLNNL